MSQKLPSLPHLDHLRRQAKDLLAALASGDAEAAKTFREHVPAAKKMTAAKVRAAGFRLADAQLAVARRTGFASWPRLAQHVEQLRALEGTWSFVHLESGGHRIPAAALASSRLLIDGDRFRTESPEAIYEGVFNIDVDADPHHIDIEFVQGPEAGKTNRGIYRLDGDSLHLCLDVNGAERPRDFVSKPGTGHAFEILQRASAARPQDVTGGSPPPSPRVPVPLVDPGAFACLPSETLRRLEGEWTPLEVVRNGDPLPPFMLKTGVRVMHANRVTISFGGQVIIDALVRIDESTSPTHIDYSNTGGASAGTVQLGIMQWRGDEAVFCMAAPGGGRPTSFDAPAGSGRTLSRWAPTPR